MSSQTTTTTRIPPSYLANTALVLSTFVTLNNANTLFRPRMGLNQLGFNSPVSPSDQKLVDGIMRMFASTRMVVGLCTWAMWWYKDYRAMGWSMLAGVLMSGVDGWVTKDVLGKGEWGHWGSAPIAVGIGAGLLALVGV